MDMWPELDIEIIGDRETLVGCGAVPSSWGIESCISPPHDEIMGNNISGGGSIQIPCDSLLDADHDSSDFHALLDSFLVHRTPLLQLDILDFSNFPCMADYYQLTAEQASHCVPLLPEWSLALGLSSATLDRACYNHVLHTLALEHACYLCNLYHKVDLEAIKEALTSTHTNLDVAVARVRELELANQQLTKLHDAKAKDATEKLTLAWATLKEVEDAIVVEQNTYTTIVSIAKKQVVKEALDKVSTDEAFYNAEAIQEALAKVAGEEVFRVAN